MSTAECGGAHGGGGEGNYTDRFGRMQKVQGPDTVRVTVFQRSTDFTVWSVVSICSVGVDNQNQRPENLYNIASLSVAKIS